MMRFIKLRSRALGKAYLRARTRSREHGVSLDFNPKTDSSMTESNDIIQVFKDLNDVECAVYSRRVLWEHALEEARRALRLAFPPRQDEKSREELRERLEAARVLAEATDSPEVPAFLEVLRRLDGKLHANRPARRAKKSSGKPKKKA